MTRDLEWASYPSNVEIDSFSRQIVRYPSDKKRSEAEWARADLNHEDFASLVLWAQTASPCTARRIRSSQAWARADLNHRIPGVPDDETELNRLVPI
jgi:hypothetical protein